MTEREIRKECELRWEIPDGSWLYVKLVSGTAEVFGVEMAPNQEYAFNHCNIAVYTWFGCKIKTWGDDSGVYATDSTPMVSYVNTHVQLEARREVAFINKNSGPRVSVEFEGSRVCV
jgi:polyribonucleotide 5'-hydroxyl-kinase